MARSRITAACAGSRRLWKCWTPRAEVLGRRRARARGFMSRSEAMNATGLDAEQVEAEIADENAAPMRSVWCLDSDPRQTTAQGQEQPTAVDDAPPPAVTEGGNDAVVN